MKAGIIGLPGAGKWTVFEALTQTVVDVAHKADGRIGTIAVPDPRVDALSELYKPRKTTYAQVQYSLPGVRSQDGARGPEQGLFGQVRDCDALIKVVRNFGGGGHPEPTPLDDIGKLHDEMVFADLVVAEKRIERIEQERVRGRSFDADELATLEACRRHLEDAVPLRHLPELTASPHLRSYSFLSGKPLLIIVNNHDEDDALPDMGSVGDAEHCAVVRGRLEHELAQMPEEEAGDFFDEYGITESAMGRVIARSYELLGLISFFTVGPDEVRAWTVRRGTLAPAAAGVIHSDLERGFIRAEVVAYDDLTAAGTHQEARKRGLVRLEGKGYEVQDGDLMDVRFSV